MTGLVNAGGLLFFSAKDRTIEQTLWKSDGTADGTMPVVEDRHSQHRPKIIYETFEQPYSGSPTAVLGNRLFFGASSAAGGNSSTKRQRTGLWQSDGTVQGTFCTKNIYPYSMVVLNDVVYFFASDGKHRYGLWRSDGTEEGTTMVKDIITLTSVNAGNATEN
jgi:ELWxxDGT repeat protein